jgi:magnesium-transporting ATPase (P-type)
MKRHFSKKFFFQKLFFVLVIIALISLIVLLLWNWLMPAIFNLPEINYLQAIGILILSKILFLGIGKHNHRDHWKNREYWEKRFEENQSNTSEKTDINNNL